MRAVASNLQRRIVRGGVARSPLVQQRRFLNLHEYQSLEIMGSYGVPVPRAAVATTPVEAEELCRREIGDGEDVVVKAQVLAGGRGLGHFTNGFQGGVHVVTGADQAREVATKMLGQTLVTKQTGAEGRPVSKVLLMERLYMRREMYFSIVMDRSYNGPVMVGSPRGGTSIEDVAASDPTAIRKIPVDISSGPTDEQLDEMAKFLGFSGEQQLADAAAAMRGLYTMMMDKDATQVEINPLAETPDGQVYVCDAKINFDDNAEFRQEEVYSMRDPSQEDQREVEAARSDLNYIGLDGSIGCLVNGAGLAMATMDIIKLHGGEPANFLDVGGGATERQVSEAFRLLNADRQVRAILVNIFGGIMRCDVIAEGIVAAAREIGLKKPLVVRLQGTNVDAAHKVIEDSGFKMIVEDDLDDAAAKAVKLADIVEQAQQMDVHVHFELPL